MVKLKSFRRALSRKAREIREVYEYTPADADVQEIVLNLVAYQRRVVNTFPRICTRVYAILSPARRQYSTPKLIGLTVAGWALDVVVWRRLRQVDRDEWLWRSSFYGVEAAAWSRFGPNGHFDSIPSLMLWPMFVELTHNQNTRTRRHVVAAMAAMVLPVVIDGKLVRSTRVPLISWRWPVIAVLVGSRFRFVLRRRLQSTEERLVEGRQSAQRAAEVAGRRRARVRLTRGHASIRDWLDRAHIQRLEDLGEDKLAQDWRYLEAKRIERHNDVEELGPVLEDWEEALLMRWTLGVDGRWQDKGATGLDGPFVVCECSPKSLEYHVLTPAQATLLREQLSALSDMFDDVHRVVVDHGEREPLVVDVAIDRRHRSPPLLGEEVHLSVNGQAVIVERDDAYRPSPDEPLDPTAIGFFLDAIWAINDLRWRPERSTGPLLAAALSLLVAAEHVARQRLGCPLGSRDIVVRAIALQAAGTLATVGKSPAWKSDGSRLVWPISRAEMPGFIAAAHWGGLSPRERGVALMLISGIATVASLTTSQGRWGRLDILLQMLFTAQAFAPGFKVMTWSFQGMERRLADLRREELKDLAMRSEIDESRQLHAVNRRVYERAVAALGERDHEAERILKDEAATIAAKEVSRSGRLKGDYADGLEALRALPPEVTTVVMDVDNTLLPYDATSVQRDAAVVDCVRLAEELQTIETLVFVSNSPIPLAQPNSDLIDVLCISRARKPWIILKPLRPHRADLRQTVVVGDQPLTDGGLALALDGEFVMVQGFGNEPRWPRFLRFIGEFVM